MGPENNPFPSHHPPTSFSGQTNSDDIWTYLRSERCLTNGFIERVADIRRAPETVIIKADGKLELPKCSKFKEGPIDDMSKLDSFLQLQDHVFVEGESPIIVT